MNLQALGKFSTLFQIIGILYVAKKIIKGLIGFYKAFLRKRKNLIKRYGKNSWALVTGASDGIGQEFCRQLAKIGFNIVLVARTEKKLKETEKELFVINPNISTKVVTADLSRANEDGYIQNIYNQVSDLDVSLLINNAGIDVFDHFDQISPQYLKDMIAVDCTALLLLNQCFVKKMNNRAHRSGIINVSSAVVQVPLAFYSSYNGVKALVDTFTYSVADEYRNIDFMSMKPYDVSTNMINNRQPDPMTISRTECVKGFLDCLGHEVQSVGHWKHRIQDYFYSLIPRRLLNIMYFNFFANDFFAERKALFASYRGLPHGTDINVDPQENLKDTKKHK